MIDMGGQEIVIPPSGGANTLSQLLTQVLSYIQIFDGHTDGEYSKAQRALAEEAGITFDRYMLRLIEHQFCVNNAARGIKCWSDGVGDTIHSALTVVDGWVAKTPEVIRNRIQNAIERITPSRARTFGGCSACGGSRVMDPRINNLGRAGRLNRL